ncbi:hypothetical protein TNCV_4266861 [Trichonephila clavipes]|nr:hypothetical protein TNCV_4266861 [Trichonephila clavipes]
MSSTGYFRLFLLLYLCTELLTSGTAPKHFMHEISYSKAINPLYPTLVTELIERSRMPKNQRKDKENLQKKGKKEKKKSKNRKKLDQSRFMELMGADFMVTILKTKHFVKIFVAHQLRKRASATAPSRCLGIRPTVTRVSHGFPKLFVLLGHGNIFVNVCGDNALCSSEGQRDFLLCRLGSLLGVLVGSFIAGAPNMTWDPL